MKKLLIVLLSVFCLAVPAAMVPESVGSYIELNVGIVKTGSVGGNHPKSPVEIPEAYLDDHTLYIGTAFCDDVTVQLVNVDDVTGGETVEYSTVLYAGDQTVVFPSTLSGTYELRILVDWYYLAGEVEL